MAVWVHCPQCDQHYPFPDAAAGKAASCPKCHNILAVAAPAPAIPNVPRLPMPAPAPPPRVPPVKAVPMDESEEPLWAVPVVQDEHRRPPRTPPPTPRLTPIVEELPEELSASGVPNTYYHEACGGGTTVSPELMAKFAGDPFSYIPGAFCSKCRRYVGLRSLRWRGTKETVAAYRAVLRRQMHPLRILLRVLGGPAVGALIGAVIGAVANPHALLLGGLAGVLIGLPLGYFVTGIVFQVAWTMAQKRKANAAGAGS